MNGLHPIRVVGVGTPMGDDAVAWEVVRCLRSRAGSWPGVEFHLAEGGQRLLDLLDGRGTLVLIDALIAGERPGVIHRLEWPDPRVEVLGPGSTHGIRPAEALQLAAALGLLPRRVLIFGVEIGNLDPGGGMSPVVAAAIPELARFIAEELEGTAGNEPDPVPLEEREHHA